MSNIILRQGVVTPFVVFNFATGSIESSIKNPRYFMSLYHNRTCKQACSFKLSIVYVPDTFSPGNPTLIDNLILTSVNQRVTYFYGYYDCWGKRHVQQQSYAGQLLTYDSDVDIISGTINYTIEGVATAVDLTNTIAKIDKVEQDKKPSVHLRNLTAANTEGGFTDLKNFYDIYDKDNTDKPVHIDTIGPGPVLDLIMGTVVSGSISNDGLPVRQGGLVQLSHAPSTMDIQEAFDIGLLSFADYDSYVNAEDQLHTFGGGDKSWYVNEQKRIIESLETPFIAFIDDCEVSGKLGTLYYKRKQGAETSNVYFYEFGNNNKESDVLGFSVTYNGAKAVAAAPATQNVISGIDADGNNIGQTEATTKVPNLSRNTFPTKSGFDENAFIAKHELADIMLYPFEATLRIIGQTIPNQLLDIIYVVVRLNGTEHPTLTGAYKVLEIVDNVDSSGFTTELKLIRQTSSNAAAIDKLETFVKTPDTGQAQRVQDSIDSVSGEDNSNGQVRNK